MRVLIDACVLVPTVLRRLVAASAEAGVFTPIWSPRILDEWSRAAMRDGYGPEAGIEIASLTATFPEACVQPDQIEGLALPDRDDVHVLAAAITAEADEILTLNTKDFPTNILAMHGLIRRHPDEFLLEAWHGSPELDAVFRGVHDRARADGSTLTLRGLFKRSRLPRLGKAMELSDPQQGPT